MKLICLPCAGASANMYLQWKKQLPSFIDLYPVELAGRGIRLSEEYIEQFDEQVDDLYQNLLAKGNFLSTPYVLFGHSMGALLAHGLVRKIEKIKKSDKNEILRLPKAVIVSACSGPSARKVDYFEDLSKSRLINDLKSKNGTPSVIFEHQELLDMFITTLKADYKVCQSFQYCHSPILKIPIFVFYGKQDDISIEDLKTWQNETSEPITMHSFAGDHFYLQPNQCEKLMLNKLINILSDY